MGEIVGCDSLRCPVTVYDDSVHGSMARGLFTEAMTAMSPGDPLTPLYEDIMRDQGHIYALVNSELRGMLGFIVPPGSSDFHLSDFHVNPAIENRSRISRALVAAAVSIAKQHGVEDVAFSARADIPRLIELYRELSGDSLEKGTTKKQSFPSVRGRVEDNITGYRASVQGAIDYALSKGGISLFNGLEMVFRDTGLGFPDEGPKRIRGLLKSFLGEASIRFGVGLQEHGVGPMSINFTQGLYIVSFCDKHGKQYEIVFDRLGAMMEVVQNGIILGGHDGKFSLFTERSGEGVVDVSVSEIVENFLPISMENNERLARVRALLGDQTSVTCINNRNGGRIFLERKPEDNAKVRYVDEDASQPPLHACIDRNGEVHFFSYGIDYDSCLVFLDGDLRYCEPI
ncbi:GNAT family N-acetyltransferase [Candidatus Peregrinibacteria bacterium]|nr:GNAT family N-acetyltransferase [Candidatus Peregrinibacteria bacterium]